MLLEAMKPHGTFKLARRGATRARALATSPLDRQGALDSEGGIDGFPNPLARSELRVQRIIESLRNEIIEAGAASNLRIRQIFETPREIFRLELEVPELGYQRTILLERDALEELLESDEIRAAVDSTTPAP
jgi:hypothetical protein